MRPIFAWKLERRRRAGAAQAGRSTGITAPVMGAESAARRKRMTRAMASGDVQREKSASGMARRLAGVSMVPGATQLKRTRRSRFSRARTRVRDFTASPAARGAGAGDEREAGRGHAVLAFRPSYVRSALTILNLARKGPVRVVDDQRGSPTFAPHLAVAIAQLIGTGAYGIWHLAGSGEASWYELTLKLLRICGMYAPVIPVTTAEFPRPAPRPRCAPLVSVREPRIRLPPWRVGLAAFARGLAEKARP